MSTNKRIVAGILAVGVVVVAFLVARPDSSTPTDPTTKSDVVTPTSVTGSSGPSSADATAPARPKNPAIQIVVKNGKPVGGVEKISVDKGDRIKFTVRSDVADEVHFHGYDISKEVGPGEPAKFSVPATLDGIYEVELEQRALPIAEIRVNP